MVDIVVYSEFQTEQSKMAYWEDCLEIVRSAAELFSMLSQSEAKEPLVSWNN